MLTRFDTSTLKRIFLHVNCVPTSKRNSSASFLLSSEKDLGLASQALLSVAALFRVRHAREKKLLSVYVTNSNQFLFEVHIWWVSIESKLISIHYCYNHQAISPGLTMWIISLGVFAKIFLSQKWWKWNLLTMTDVHWEMEIVAMGPSAIWESVSARATNILCTKVHGNMVCSLPKQMSQSSEYKFSWSSIDAFFGVE